MFSLQEIDTDNRWSRPSWRLPVPLSGAQRMHQRDSMVWWNIALSFRIRWGINALLIHSTTATLVLDPRGAHYTGCNRCSLLGFVSSLQTQTAVHTPDTAQEPLIRHRHHRGEGSDLLTQRQFCAIRWGRSCHHGVTPPAT